MIKRNLQSLPLIYPKLGRILKLKVNQKLMMMMMTMIMMTMMKMMKDKQISLLKKFQTIKEHNNHPKMNPKMKMSLTQMNKHRKTRHQKIRRLKRIKVSKKILLVTINNNKNKNNNNKKKRQFNKKSISLKIHSHNLKIKLSIVKLLLNLDNLVGKCRFLLAA